MEKPLGAEGGLSLKLENSKVILTVSYDGKGVDGALTAAAELEYFVDKVFDLIPGDSALEQMAKAVLKQTLKGMKV